MKIQRQSRKIINIIISSFFILLFLLSIGLGTFFITTIKDTKLQLKKNEYVNQTIIYDKFQNPIETIGQKDTYIAYEDIPQILIDSLLSIEDNEFFYHDGFNLKRIFTSFLNNVFNKTLQGGSTISQQLIKNMALTNEKTYNRKIKEFYLSILLEQNYSKQEILELYFNKVYFEQSIPGIVYASRTFFNKEVNQLNYLESAILVGLVKSPSYYYPYKYPENTNKRKNLVLKKMYENNVISYMQYQNGIKINVESLLYYPTNEVNNNTYPYQAYLDVVYEEVKKLTGKDLYTHALIVETYLDTYLQKEIDEIQKGNIIQFIDDNQQIGGVVIDNQDASIIGIIGGRNYQGKKLFNHAYHLKRNPASTIKPLLSYTLAVENLNYHPLTTLIDEPYKYLGTNINVNNADKNYLGKITLTDALGYSRNTCAVETFDLLVDKIGKQSIIDYLKTLDLFDQGTLTSSYALGGMTYGLSPIQMGGGYTFLARHGQFSQPSTIKRIIDYSGKVIYERDTSSKQIISRESSDLITYSLKKVIDKNYLNIQVAKPNGIEIAGKTGTNAYDSSTRIKYQLPNNADKDIWFSGYSNSHTCVVWSGFDEVAYQKNYFGSSDPKKKVPKQIFKYLMEKISSQEKLEFSDTLKEISLVKGLNDDYLPNEYISNSIIEKTLINPEITNPKPLPDLQIEKIDDVDIFQLEDSFIIQVNNELKKDEIYSSLLGEKTIYLIVNKSDGTQDIITSTNGYFDYDINTNLTYSFELKVGFKNNSKIFGESYIFTYSDNFL